VGPDALGTFSVVFAAAAAMVFLSGHLGLGALFAGAAFVLGSLAVVPHPLIRAPFVESLRSLGELLALVGFFAGVARTQSGVVSALALVVVALWTWLPLVRARAGDVLLPPTAGLWRRGDRMALLLVGCVVGRPVPMLVALALVSGLDGWLRVARLAGSTADASAPARGAEPRKSWLVEGHLSPHVRWASLAAVAVGLFLFPVDARWRF
jgi:hypothetical protein